MQHARNIFKVYKIKYLNSLYLNKQTETPDQKLLLALVCHGHVAVHNTGTEPTHFEILKPIPTPSETLKMLESTQTHRKGPNFDFRGLGYLAVGYLAFSAIFGAILFASGGCAGVETYGNRRDPRIDALQYLDNSWNRAPAYYPQPMPYQYPQPTLQHRCYDQNGMVRPCQGQ